ncbi:Uma2 family endonuclease [Euhalothece natronophila Z-M001]|uniref:Uma2 family endonuclease n=1 Tax=Euhalothece natronophila Z-M001 TaxID=522448 RepID=A0A5B8NHS7_9CHRO|nr:Uma2 family endonuclease [Euhalothece natronophila]QDZ38498.1 Uma2 family endonuclease [Euhalothece natronophila Z-M001]
MVQISDKTITLEEFLKQPETKPAQEYINGQIIQKPRQQGKHSILQCELVNTINGIVKKERIAHAFPELRCTFGGSSIVPDVTVFAWERIPVDESVDIANVFPLAPDWIIEILSPDQSSTKVTGIILHSLNHGSEMGWLIDPKARSILVFPHGQQPQLLKQPEEILPVPNLVGDLRLSVADVFSWLKL